MGAIYIQSVTPTAHELRTLRRGWGGIHWACIIPTYAFLIGFLIYGFIVQDGTPVGLFGVALIASVIVWWAGLQLTQRLTAKAHHNSPTGRLVWDWTIDNQTITFDNGLQSNRVDWRAVKSVTENPDRFVFLVTPAYNPVLPTRLLTASQLADLKALIHELTISGRLGSGLDEVPSH